MFILVAVLPGGNDDDDDDVDDDVDTDGAKGALDTDDVTMSENKEVGI